MLAPLQRVLLYLKNASGVPTAPAAPVTTPQQQFFQDLFQWLGVKKAVDAGLVPAEDKAFTTLTSTVQGEFQSAYVLVPGWPIR